MTVDNKTQMLLAHLKQTVVQFEAGYALMTEARAELHKVAQNFQLQSIPLPSEYAAPVQQQAQTDEATFEVAIWPNNTGSKLKASGLIDGTNYRIILFAGTKEGVSLSGSIVPSDAPDGVDLKDISMGYACVKPNKAGDGYELSLKFTQLDDWFTGPMQKVTSDNPKAPAFKAVMHKSTSSKPSPANNPLLNVLQQLDVPKPDRMPTDAEDVVTDMLADMPFGGVDAAPVAAPPNGAPDLSDFFNKPAPQPTLEQTPQGNFVSHSTPTQAAPQPDPVADLFAATAKVPSVEVPSWLLS